MGQAAAGADPDAHAVEPDHVERGVVRQHERRPEPVVVQLAQLELRRLVVRLLVAGRVDLEPSAGTPAPRSSGSASSPSTSSASSSSSSKSSGSSKSTGDKKSSGGSKSSSAETTAAGSTSAAAGNTASSGASTATNPGGTTPAEDGGNAAKGASGGAAAAATTTGGDEAMVQGQQTAEIAGPPTPDGFIADPTSQPGAKVPVSGATATESDTRLAGVGILGALTLAGFVLLFGNFARLQVFGRPGDQ